MVALPIRNTEYSSSWTGPLRAPMIRSVPEIVEVKLFCASVRIRYTPSSRVTARAIETTVSPAVALRLNRLFSARVNMAVTVRSLPCSPMAYSPC